MVNIDNSSKFKSVCLDEVLNNRGVTDESDKGDGGINIWGNSFSKNNLPEFGLKASHGKIPFTFQKSAKTGFDNVVCRAQQIKFGPTKISSLHFLAISERSNVAKICITHAGSILEILSVGVSDFWPDAPPNFGNELFLRGKCLHYPKHIQDNMHPSIWYAASNLQNTGIEADGLLLPDNPAIHIFAITLESPQ